jgi:hypothetical protein
MDKFDKMIHEKIGLRKVKYKENKNDHKLFNLIKIINKFFQFRTNCFKEFFYLFSNK